MANLSEISTATSIAFVKFVECCTGTEILFRGTLNIVPGGECFSYEGSTPLSGTGGILEPGKCYTVTQEYSSAPITYPAAPTLAVLSNKQDCTDAKCPSCQSPSNCNCPEGYTQSEDGSCEKVTTTTAQYSGQLLTLTTGNKSKYYCDSGLRLYPDITSMTWPVYGDGADNASYTVKQNNGAGALVAPIGNVQSEVWGKGSNPCWTNTSGGRLNIAGVWATGYPVNKELSFEFCITVEGTKSKQYMLGLAGDNYVKFYIDGNLAVFLNVPDDGTTTPFRHWHTFPITLSPGSHIIKLAGLNLGSSAAFAGEIYNIDLPTFQANLMAPAVSAGNCGTSPAQLNPFIIFSTKDMVGKQVANPNVPGQWTCPNGGEVNYCNGTPSCTVTEKLTLSCACYMLIPCDNTDPFVTNNEDFEQYINGFVNVESQDIGYFGCVYVQKLEGNDCLDSVNVFPSNADVCDCDLKCYYVQGSNGFIYIDADNVLQEVTSNEADPYIKLCSKVYPKVENNSQGYQIVDFGNCVDGECPTLCFKLENCDTDEVIYSNSDSLIPYLYSSSNVVKIIGRGGCWEVSLSNANCDCIQVDISSINPQYPSLSANALLIGTYNGYNLYSFVYNNVTYYIWFGDLWAISANGYGSDPAREDILRTREYLGPCPASIDEGFTWFPRIEGVSGTTQKCPAVCDCPIDVTVTSSYETCEDCIGYISYKLTSCTNNDIIYTLDDLSDYVNKVVKLDCGCYTVEQLDILPPNTQTVNVESIFDTCTECTRTYWKLTDCQDNQNTLITYSDLSLYEGKVIKVENCDECWKVEITDEFLNAGVVTVVNNYADCEECGAPTICQCTKITNLNPETKSYYYYDCLNTLQRLELTSGQTSDKVCALEWLTESPYCKCIQFKLKGESYYAFIIPGEIENNRPVYNLCTYGDTNQCGIVYWNGSNWVIASEEGAVFWILPTSTSSLCPYGDWQATKQVNPREKAAVDSELTSQPCEDVEACDCFTLTTSEGETFTFYPLTIDIYGNPIYTTSEGRIISYEPKNFCWRFDVFQDFNYFFCQDLYTACPIGNWNAPYGLSTAVTELCPDNNQFTVYDYFETFGECKNGVCPPPVFKNNRTVRPGYNTPICTPEKYDEITCRFADILYKIALEKRYGITNCCPEEDDKWLIKKELIDLQALKDPNYNCPDCICSCNSGKTYSTCNCKN